jgi:hypothetical protein
MNYAVFRNESPSLGRFSRPDPYDGSYDLTDPQSLNRYSYVGNRPLIFLDPSGLDCIYQNSDGSTSVLSGDCASPLDNGYYVDGTITSLSYSSDTGNISYQYNPYDGPADSFITGVGTIYGSPMAPSSTLSNMDIAVSYSFIEPIYEGIGPAFSIATVPNQKLFCIGGGIGASEGRSSSLALLALDSKSAESILSGASLSFGYNLTFWKGLQLVANSSGYGIGPSIGSPGASISITGSDCVHWQ